MDAFLACPAAPSVIALVPVVATGRFRGNWAEVSFCGWTLWVPVVFLAVEFEGRLSPVVGIAPAASVVELEVA